MMELKEVPDTIFGFPKYPKFEDGKSRFPQETFLGRYLNYLDVVDPSTLFTSDAKLQEYKDLLKAHKEGKATASDKELWKAKKTVSAVTHPDTGDKILQPFRMSGYVPFGWITVTGMLLPNPSMGTIAFWQWMNQSHNAAVNYANRNASQPQPLQTYFFSYCVAVGSALSISLGLTKLLKKASALPPTSRSIVQRFVPLPATSLASSLNCICMRWKELDTGIAVSDKDGNVVGVSKEAAYRAVRDTTAVRAFLPVPLLLIPPCIMPFLEKYKWVSGNKYSHLFVNAVVCTLSFAASLPVALALFPQVSTISVKDLEPELREKTKHLELYYNKGL